MKTNLYILILLIFSISNIYSQRPLKIEVSNCGYAANDEYIVGPDMNGCQCFDRVNANDRIAIWIHPNLPDTKYFVFEAGKTCGDGLLVTNPGCLSPFVSDNCYIIDSHGSANCDNCIVTVLERDPCFDILSINNQIIPEETYQSFERILSNGTVGTNTHVIFKSNEILLNPDFEVKNPSIFEAVIEPDDCVEDFCPPFEEAPTFVESLPNLILLANDSCKTTIDIPFAISYRFPDRLSFSLLYWNSIYGFDDSSIFISTSGIEDDSIAHFILNGTLPVGSNMLYIDVRDANCNLDNRMVFKVNVNDSTTPSMSCPADTEILLNQNCTIAIPNFINELSISNTCLSTMSLQNIIQFPSPGTLINGASSSLIKFTATDDFDSTYTCQFYVHTVDSLAPAIFCPNGIVSIPLDQDCQSIIPDFRGAVDNCDVLIPTNTDSVDAIIYQNPLQGSVWDGVSNLKVFAMDASGNRDTCQIDLQRSCPSFSELPIFLQSPSDLSFNGDENCEGTISLPFSIDYCMPEFLSVSLDVNGPNSTEVDLTITNASVDGTELSYTIDGTVPFGTHTVTLIAEDQECGLSTAKSFTLNVTDPNLPTDYNCQWLVREIGSDGTVALHSEEIVDQEYDCYPSSTIIISSYSYTDFSDNVSFFTCDDLGAQQMTVFTWDVLDIDNSGVLDTFFRNVCLSVQTIIDPDGYCDL